MARFFLFFIIACALLLYILPPNIVQEVPYGLQLKRGIEFIRVQTIKIVKDVTTGAYGNTYTGDAGVSNLLDFIKQEARQGLDAIKNDAKESLKDQVNQEIDEGVDRVFPEIK